MTNTFEDEYDPSYDGKMELIFNEQKISEEEIIDQLPRGIKIK